jgi:hypothetical protein
MPSLISLRNFDRDHRGGRPGIPEERDRNSHANVSSADWTPTCKKGPAEKPLEGNMSDDLEQLIKAREALIRERRTRTATIASTSGSISDAAMDAFIKVENAIESVELAIERLQDEEEEDGEE